MRNKKLILSEPFEKLLRKLPGEIQKTTFEKLELFQRDPSHPSLRVKKMKGTRAIWEMSVTMHYRITFEVLKDAVYLRRIGVHDILDRP
ncbi:MAG: cytotoxin [Candidatus Omnitrophica bacterium]|nr:cytotoxin [Candidatus Omnitrophota bacterium]